MLGARHPDRRGRRRRRRRRRRAGPYERRRLRFRLVVAAGVDPLTFWRCTPGENTAVIRAHALARRRELDDAHTVAYHGAYMTRARWHQARGLVRKLIRRVSRGRTITAPPMTPERAALIERLAQGVELSPVEPYEDDDAG